LSLPLVTRFGADPLLDLEVANKRYVDNSSGGTGQTFARVVKKIDETIQSSNTLHDDDELFIALNINKVYHFIGSLYYDSGSTPDFKYAATFPTSATNRRVNDNWQSITKRNTSDFSTVSGNIAGVGAAIGTVAYEGFIVMSTTAGNFQIQWAQNTSAPEDTIVKAGSFLVVWEETS